MRTPRNIAADVVHRHVVEHPCVQAGTIGVIVWGVSVRRFEGVDFTPLGGFKAHYIPPAGFVEEDGTSTCHGSKATAVFRGSFSTAVVGYGSSVQGFVLHSRRRGDLHSISNEISEGRSRGKILHFFQSKVGFGRVNFYHT